MKRDDRRAGRGAGVSIERARRGNGVIVRPQGRDANQGYTHAVSHRECRAPVGPIIAASLAQQGATEGGYE
jgi:hypothetical protein